LQGQGVVGHQGSSRVAGAVPSDGTSLLLSRVRNRPFGTDAHPGARVSGAPASRPRASRLGRFPASTPTVLQPSREAIPEKVENTSARASRCRTLTIVTTHFAQPGPEPDLSTPSDVAPGITVGISAAVGRTPLI